jgi:hypothetical protein
MQGVIAHYEPVANRKPVANALKRAPLPVFGALAVTDVNRGGVVVTCCQRGANAGIHSAAKQDDCATLFTV